MKKVKNPFLLLDNYCCFACSPHNPHGLQLQFYEEEGEVFALFDAKQRFEGFPGMLHGGIAGTILDEVMFWASFVKMQIMTVTMSMELKYKLPVSLDREYKARGKVVGIKRRSVICESSIEDGDKTVYCLAKGVYFIPEKRKFSDAARIDVDKGPLAGFFR
ncbi:PaaI family thioesterase [candidate division WOR-3 bacterium]|nr:PaaI family thioesterase [candidate division WOR-3 bacterium]